MPTRNESRRASDVNGESGDFIDVLLATNVPKDRV